MNKQSVLKVSDGFLLLGAGVVIGYLFAVKRCPKAPLASERPVTEQETDGKVVHGQFGGSERKAG